MAVFARFMGLLAVAVGIIAAVLPLVVKNALAANDAMMLMFIGVFAGISLVSLARILTIAERIEANTNWFAAAQSKPAQADAEPNFTEPSPPVGENKNNKQAPTQAAPPEPKPATAEPAPQTPAAAPPPKPAVAAPRGRKPQPPEIYDAAQHPPAIEEWTYGKTRVMTLQDGTVATELEGVWRRFASVEDMAAFLRLPAQPGSKH